MRIVIVGGVAGGASIAARARRLAEKAAIIIFEKGPDVSFANCGIPYYLGGSITERSKLNVQTPASLKNRLNLDVRVNTEIVSVDVEAKKVKAKETKTGREYEESYDELVLAMGAKPLKPPIPGIDRDGNFAIRNLEDMDVCQNWLNGTEKGGHIVVAGAGFIGVEMAEQLQERGFKVTVVERMPQIMAPFDREMAALLQTEMEKHGITVLVDSTIKAFEARQDGKTRGSDVVLDGKRLPADMVVLGLGVQADSALAKEAGIKLNQRGGIIVDSKMKTSAPHVWAIGDAVEVANPILGGVTMIPLAGPANRQGRLVADNICGKVEREYKGTYGTAVVKCFSLTAACVGPTEGILKQRGLPYQAIYTHPPSHASYYPNSKVMSLKVLFNPNDGKLYGAQCIGEDGADKRIDVLATALQAGMTMDDIAELELCYAPPVGSAKDPVNHAGFIAQNVMEGLVKLVTWDQFPTIASDESVFVLDVRNPGEIQNTGMIHPKAVNIPVDSLRSRLGEVPKDKKIICSCMTGQRSYYACRILMQEGFDDVSNLTGAWKTWAQLGKKIFP